MSVIQQILNHRSIRKYKPDPIPEDLLHEILQAGIRTSSSGNMQTYSIIVTRDQHLREKLLKPHMGQKMVVDAPVFLTFCADFNRMRRWLKINDAADNFDNFFSFLIGSIDAILVSQTVALAAESHGLGLCFLGSTLANADAIGKILGLPKNVVPVAGFSLGYPDEQPDLRDRLPFSGLVHWETYSNYSDLEIQDIYSERDNKGWQRYMKSKWLREQDGVKGIENLAQLYTEVKYTRSSHQDYSRKLLTYLENQEFMINEGD
ncbi:MAG: nitroreductase family protein [Anaerolineales bacterium]|nr:nitroreductase family protein [Anaerolineales bacterium]